MDYFMSDEAEKGKFTKSNREVQEEKEPSKSEPFNSVDVKTTKEEFLRSNTEVQDRNIINSVIIDDEENFESLNSDIKIEKEESLKTLISNAQVQKETNLEESVESNNINEVKISKDVPSSVSVGNPSNIYVSTCRPSLIYCNSSGDLNPEESSKSNIADKLAPNLEETGLDIHKTKLLNLHRELKQFHSFRKSTPKDLSEKKISGDSRPNEDSQPVNGSINKSCTNTQLPSVSNESKASEALKETESTSIVSSQTLSEQIKSSIQIVSNLPSTSSGFSRNLETLRSAEGISSASLENRNSQFVRLETNKLTGAQYIAMFIPLFDHLLDDLLEIHAFLDVTRRVSCNPCDDPEYGPIINERLLASITEDFGTGVESTVAQNTRSLLSKLNSTRHVAAAVRTQHEHRPEATAEEGFKCLRKFDAEQKTVAESREREPSVSSHSISLQESIDLQSTTVLDPIMEAETNLFVISKQLSRLNTVARHRLCCYIGTTVEVLECFTTSPCLFLPRLERFMAEILDVLEDLVCLRQECSALLSRCRNRKYLESVMYILKVKTHIADVYNKLLKNLLTLTSSFIDSCFNYSD